METTAIANQSTAEILAEAKGLEAKADFLDMALLAPSMRSDSLRAQAKALRNACIERDFGHLVAAR